MLQTQVAQSLGNHLVLKHATIEDAPRLNAFNALIHDPYEGVQTEAMMLHHPTIRPENFIYIEDEATGQIVSSLGLLPWRWRFDEIELKLGEMAIVGTLPAYRHRGLVRILANHFKECLAEGEYDLSFLGASCIITASSAMNTPFPSKGTGICHFIKSHPQPRPRPPTSSARLPQTTSPP